MSGRGPRKLHAAIVVNVHGGTLRRVDTAGFADHLEKAMSDAGHVCDVRLTRGRETIETLKQLAASSTHDTLVAVGGDGTVSAAAALAHEHNKILGVIPAGTMNLFARTLGMPLELFEAATALAGARIRDADVSTANGRVFVHQFSVGLQARIVIERQKLGYSSRFSKIVSGLVASAGALLNPPAFDAELNFDGESETGRFSLIAISSNPHGEGHMPYPDTVDAGRLGVYRAPVMPAAESARAASDMVLGTWRNNASIESDEAEQVHLRFPRLKRSAKAVIDGEVIPLEREVKIRITKAAMRVLAAR